MKIIEKTVHTQNEINNENEDNMRPGTPRALLVDEDEEYEVSSGLLRDSAASDE